MTFDKVMESLHDTTKGSVDKLSKKPKKNKKFADGGESDLGPSGLAGGADQLKKSKGNKKRQKNEI